MGGGIVEGGFCYEEETQLTVLKTSLFFAGDGFTVYDCKGQLVFRVDSYGPDSRDKDELVLMDAAGKCLLTVRRKRPSLHHRWEGYLGERRDGQKPIFSVRRSSIIGRSSVTVEVYGSTGSPRVEEYQIEGSFSHRCCTFYNTSRESVAEIKRKVVSCANVVLGKDVFCLCLKPGFDGAFAMGLVLVLDQINGDDDPINVSEDIIDSPTTDDTLPRDQAAVCLFSESVGSTVSGEGACDEIDTEVVTYKTMKTVNNPVKCPSPIWISDKKLPTSHKSM